ncbi:MAG: glucose-1-phosphate adenylyltransferase [Clostridia bacterium]|nr:glucose-1-phosphate adenylyltransferase [Clostridia bacterium]
MFPKQETVAMLLAGGQGSRLYVLTSKVAKPAVAYGGKYRIIDFPLSNCVNSGINAVGVLTQYQPLLLNEYIGNGQPWDLDGSNSGVTVLPPYQRSKGADWYKGTANAIYQNIAYVDRYNPDYVVVLSGDHIYKMDYSEMIAAHKERNADCTIAVLDVPIEEASRFGILNTNPDNSIYEFDEKPKHPKSTKASMGIYCFTWQKLRKYLIEDEENADSKHDFGMNVLPAMLNSGERMFAFEFEGYWKDVGTIQSLWEANMDLLNPDSGLKLNDSSWSIYSRTPILPPQYIGEDAKLTTSLVADGSVVFGDVDHSVLFPGAKVAKGAVVKQSVLMPGAVVEEGAVVEYAIVSENAVVKKNAKVGSAPENTEADWGIAVVGSDLTVGEGAVVKANEIIYEDVNGGDCK